MTSGQTTVVTARRERLVAAVASASISGPLVGLGLWSGIWQHREWLGVTAVVVSVIAIAAPLLAVVRIDVGWVVRCCFGRRQEVPRDDVVAVVVRHGRVHLLTDAGSVAAVPHLLSDDQVLAVGEALGVPVFGPMRGRATEFHALGTAAGRVVAAPRWRAVAEMALIAALAITAIALAVTGIGRLGDDAAMARAPICTTATTGCLAARHASVVATDSGSAVRLDDGTWLTGLLGRPPVDSDGIALVWQDRWVGFIDSAGTVATADADHGPSRIAAAVGTGALCGIVIVGSLVRRRRHRPDAIAEPRPGSDDG